MNVRMVNAVFEGRCKPALDPAAVTGRFLAHVPDYDAHGVNVFTLCLRGGMPGYEGALNSAFEADGSLRGPYLARVARHRGVRRGRGPSDRPGRTSRRPNRRGAGAGSKTRTPSAAWPAWTRTG